MERSAIKLLHKRGKSQRQIARELGYSRVTVARVLQEPVEPPPARRQRSSIVDPYREQIAGWVGEGLSATRMLELARADPARPYPGRHSVFRAAVREERLRQQHVQAVAEVAVRFEGLPAEYLQVDWGEVPQVPFTQQRPVTRSFLACRLKYSRWMWIRFTTDMRQNSLRSPAPAWASRLLRHARLGALGADLRQYEGRHRRTRSGRPAALDLGVGAAGAGVRLPPGSLYAWSGQSEGLGR